MKRPTFPARRGRKPTAALSAMPVDVKARPPEPPWRLTSEERAVWEEVTSTVRPDWFRRSEVLFEVFCRAVATERRSAELVRQSDPAILISRTS
jgi:hypothetical protein